MMEISTTTRAFAFPKAREPASAQPLAEKSEELESQARDRKDAARRPWRNEPGFEKVGNWEQYLSIKESFAILELARLRRTYDEFKSDLGTLHPDLAGKDFSFALDAGGIKILDPTGALSNGEKNRLAQSLSQYRGFGEQLASFSKALALLATHNRNGRQVTQTQDANPIGQFPDLGKILDADTAQLVWHRDIDPLIQRARMSISETV
ncbi:hypothetical protein [Pseudomonas sp. W2-17]|uniref:hypothetical protein n=1 Tax=Pseudomonas sp. W2-17 TaxID=3058039 RepID=UPI0034E09ED9